jgi:hypothetical protein
MGAETATQAELEAQEARNAERDRQVDEAFRGLPTPRTVCGRGEFVEPRGGW